MPTVISKRLRFEVLRRDGHRCWYCGISASETDLVIDHVIPVALGGRTEPENLVAACRACNSGKSSVMPNDPYVAFVKEDTQRWATARQMAYDALLAEEQEVEDTIDYFAEVWNGWGYDCAKCDKRHTIPLPDDWRDSIRTLIGRGLTDVDFDRFIPIAMRKPKLQRENRFPYFCGCCWNRLDEIERRAEALIQEREC